MTAADIFEEQIANIQHFSMIDTKEVWLNYTRQGYRTNLNSEFPCTTCGEPFAPEWVPSHSMSEGAALIM